MESNESRKLAVFDMDGTLLPGATACQYIAHISGTTDLVIDLEARYSAGSLSAVEFAQITHASWAVHGPELYRTAHIAARKIRNIDRTLAHLAQHGYATCLITMAPKAFAAHFGEFDHIHGSAYPDTIITPQDKPTIALEVARQYQIEPDGILAFGDSASDGPLFEAISRTVAVNGDNQIESLARHRYRGDDLFDAMMLALSDDVDQA
ncbi:HAD family hydrolase [Nocardia ninae]|uniref:phosphoserine phosphatase n=1 Tax=Nocardia ninae NBRC 108245 TaxID=1210091 RepID=A0A511MLU9_9NOCA|nr:HAD family hydrolase [Nocardia ninae]GEM41603.1 hypothetical protein NN4_61220 [Nocardia ninae NBRC 108245]